MKKHSRPLKENVSVWKNIKNRAGWQIWPNALLKERAKLGIDLNELLLIQYVLQFQFDEDRLPNVRIRTLASMMGKSETTIKDWKKGLQEKGLLKLRPEFKNGSQWSNRWDFSPLVRRVERLIVQQQEEGGGSEFRPTLGRPADPPGAEFRPPLQEDSREEDKEKKTYVAAVAPLQLANDPNPGEKSGHPVLPLVKVQTSSADDAARQEPSVGVRLDEAKQTEQQAKLRASAQRQTNEKRVKEKLAKNLEGSPIPVKYGKALAVLERVWLDELRDSNKGVDIPGWEKKNFKLAKDLLTLYEAAVVESAFKYVIRCWPQLRKRFWKDGRGGAVPGVGFVRKFHDTIFPEAQKWCQFEPDVREWREFAKKNPNSFFAPGDLEARFKKAKTALSEMGIEV